MGNTCPSLQLALRNRLGQICRIRLWSNTLAATLSSSFYERRPDAIDCSSSLFVGCFGTVRRRFLLGLFRCQSADQPAFLPFIPQGIARRIQMIPRRCPALRSSRRKASPVLRERPINGFLSAAGFPGLFGAMETIK